MRDNSKRIMATISAKVFEHHKKSDGTYNVKICVQHKRLRKYLDTNHYVVKKQLTKDFKIKDPFIADKVEQQLREYRKEISELGDKLDFFTAETLRDYLRDKDEDIDFVKFCDKHIEGLRKDGRERTADKKLRFSIKSKILTQINRPNHHYPRTTPFSLKKQKRPPQLI